MKKFTETCPECKEKLEGKSWAMVRRRMGYHRLNKHGVPGMSATDAGKRYASNYRRQIELGEPHEKADAHAKMLEERYQARKAATVPTANGAPPPKKKGIQPMALDRCPDCGSEFFVRSKAAGHDAELEPLGISYCPRCNLRFYGAHS